MLLQSLRSIAPALCVAVALLACSTPAHAIMMRPNQIPADRLIANLQAYIVEHPEDAQAYYLLGRVHYIAFFNKTESISGYKEGSAEELPSVPDPRLRMQQKPDEPLGTPELIDHARLAIANFQKAIDLDAENMMYHLGYAGVLEQSAEHAEFIGKLDELEPLDEEDEDAQGNLPDLTTRYIEEALAINLFIYREDRDDALAKDSVFAPYYPVAYEAGKAYLRLIEAHEALNAESDELVAQINADIEAIDSKPMMITPIILRLTGEAPRNLNELLDSDAVVNFDLDADGTAERRPWVNPDTAFLVWDPEHTGQITSGRQLFGNMTFFMLFSDGYRALDTLDDDRDGQLTGEELAGLALWTDSNTNGISDEGEVTPIAQTPIHSLATTMTGNEQGHPLASHGVTLDDGTTRTTWDWIIPAAE